MVFPSDLWGLLMLLTDASLSAEPSRLGRFFQGKRARTKGVSPCSSHFGQGDIEEGAAR